MYLNSEAFTNYFTAALSSRTVPSFRQRFRNVDVLLIDNIEFLDNKRATQEEFLHTIVQVAEHGGQVVVSSDRHPRLLTRHREELTTRFMSGLVCKVENPDEETCRRLSTLRVVVAEMCVRFREP
jgi:chromosomal replication initiator protein